MKLNNFRELLAKKASKPELEKLISVVRDDVLVDLVFESLEKMAEKGSKAPGAVMNWVGGGDSNAGDMLHDALGHHVSKYKAALDAGDRKVADQHLERTVHLMDLAAKASPHAKGAIDFHHVPLNPWEMNRTGSETRVNDKGVTRYKQDTKGTGRRLSRTGRGDFSDYRYLEESPHEDYRHKKRLSGHTGGYPFEEMRFGDKYIHVDHDTPYSGKYEPHEFDKHPMFEHEQGVKPSGAMTDLKPRWEHKEDHRTDEARKEYADKLHQWETASPHVEKWIDRHIEMEDADPEGYAARGKEPSKPVLSNVSKDPKNIDVDALPDHLKHLANFTSESSDETPQQADDGDIDTDALPDHLKHLVPSNEASSTAEDEIDKDALPEHLRHLVKANDWDPEDMHGMSIVDDPNADTDDEAAQWLREAEKKSSSKKDNKEDKGTSSKSDKNYSTSKHKSTHVDDMHPDDLKEHQSLAHHWINHARQYKKQKADPKKNPVLFGEGHRVAAHNKSHSDYNKAYSEFKDSDQYQSMSPARRRKAEREFKKDWLDKNPEHYHKASQDIASAHQMHDKAGKLYENEKQQQIEHIIRGGSSDPTETMTQEEAIQHAGGSRDDEGTSSVTSGRTVESAYAGANKDFIEHMRQQRGDKRSADVEEDYLDNPELSTHRHPSLQSEGGKAKIDKMFNEYGGLINKHIKGAKGFLETHNIPESAVDEGDLYEAGMMGLMGALKDYKPDSGTKFNTYAGQRIAGEMRSHIGSLDPVHRELRSQQKMFDKQRAAVKPTTEEPKQSEQPTASQTVIKPAAVPQEAAKPSVDVGKFSDDQHDRYKRILSARNANKKPGGE